MEVEAVYLHLSIDRFEMRPMNKDPSVGTFSLYRVVPPGEIYYFFTVMPSALSRVAMDIDDEGTCTF